MRNESSRFVIQKHSKAGEVHWDLMLEAGQVLQTYRLEVPPEKISRQVNTAVKIFDHPLKFLAYEGSVNEGKGNVKIAEAGTYRVLSENQESQTLQLEGEILKGKFSLTHIKDDDWQFELVG
ncbi:MAG: hypothetical protein KAS75_03005 [Planctomycetes bacterium]|nr:hypothetical protein [Planctomycetota bacterium]